ncbi:uncharacterized protein OCT59_009867 [Rhizophagus irregularis]|uniref:Uncharacterized protein n=4 Tax=Rhizophagus irregularis TaxID=588596 RepID=A0A015JQS6_RHIIW|nr:hypothetical protein RirG_207640 [Rhizophagus irregularis DAOM 197198w]UZO18554.1 hypothetical protein OCT59_009867 [Rhizophagus irregularis]GBC29259.1 hypothetical protein GLOIN_2v1678993 [Rhizophagus irregularis DAOM 181602=DAOM 197198]CAG8702102.1 2503_t:CDS:1 [Rhizophagus irregularis]
MKDRNYSLEEIKELEQECFELKDDNKRISNELNKCSKERDTYKMKHDESEDRVKRLEAICTEYEGFKYENNNYLKINNENNDLKTRLECLSTENEKLKKEHAAMCKENDKLEAHLKLKNNKQTNHSVVYNDNSDPKVKPKELRTLVSSLKSDKEKLTYKLAETEENLERTRAENKILKDKISSKIPDNYSAIRNENDKLKAQLENLTITLHAESAKLKKVTADYEVMCGEHDQLKIHLKNEKNKISTSKSPDNYSAIRNENVKLKAQLENLTTTLRTESAKLKKVTTDCEVMCNKHDKLKFHLENEKLKNDKLTTNLSNDNSNLKGQIREYKKSFSILSSEKEVLTNQLAESVAENNKLKNKISTSSKIPDNYSAMRNENDRLKTQLKQFEVKLKEKSKYDRLATDIKVNNGEIGKFQKRPNELEEIRQIHKKNEEYVKEINKLNNLLQKGEEEKQELIENNINLKKEASQYQSELGTITNYRMDDDDKNHSVQLKKDIEKLQNKLINYVTTLKGDCEIDFNAVNGLMERYHIKTKITPKQPNKPLIKAVLQHHVIKKITKDIREYFKQNSKEESTMHLEAEIATKAKDLENKLAYFSKTRSGTDTVTQAASIKIRQEVNIALGNRGFSDVLSGENYVSHGYTIINKAELNKEINKYRIIKDENKRKYVEKLAPDLIREFIRMIQFRLKVQEPSAQMKWIKMGSNINPSIMEGNWDEDDIDNLEVEVCFFPMIGQNLDDVKKRKIYTHAQVFTKRKKFTSYLGNVIPKENKKNLELESDEEGVE